MKPDTFRVDLKENINNISAGVITIRKDGKVILSRKLSKLPPDDKQQIDAVCATFYHELCRVLKRL